MTSFSQSSTVSAHLPNAFTTTFLRRLAERDEPPTAGDADVAGPWRIEPIPGHGFGLFRVGESLARGFAPTAVFPSRWLALLMAGVLPGTGKDPILLLSKQPDAHGVYPVALAGGSDGGDGGDGDGPGDRVPVGFLQLFDERAVDALNVVIHLLQAPECLAYVLEAAGGVALERCGAILDERLPEVGAEDADGAAAG
ncbi:MAG TPA: hypothetical protein VEL74_12400 [Thermoanaerobaculia bacterium]|nr:hypothetical protein [Thermoanaerobaculia bacterium]